MQSEWMGSIFMLGWVINEGEFTKNGIWVRDTGNGSSMKIVDENYSNLQYKLFEEFVEENCECNGFDCT